MEHGDQYDAVMKILAARLSDPDYLAKSREILEAAEIIGKLRAYHKRVVLRAADLARGDIDAIENAEPPTEAAAFDGEVEG